MANATEADHIALRERLLADPERETAYRARFTAVYIALGILGFLGLFGVVRWTTATVRVDRVYTDRSVVDAAVVAKSLTGKRVVDGSQLGLPDGTVCYFGKNATGTFVVCPG